MVVVYLALLLGLGGLWLTRGYFLGSNFGGLFFGLLVYPELFVCTQSQRRWLQESAFSVGAVTMVMLGTYKENALLAPDWVATPLHYFVGSLGFILPMAMAATMDWAHTPQNVTDAQRAKLIADRENNQSDQPRQFLSSPW